MRTEEIEVTPALAEEWLATRNTHNRPMSQPYVRELAVELAEGRWTPTHQGIAFDELGALLDGQHRLAAIVRAQVAVRMLVTWDVPRAAFAAVDQHRKRTGGQMLAMSGIAKDAPRLVAMARAILATVHNTPKPSNAAAVAYATEHQASLEKFLPVARRFTPACGAAFAWAYDQGWGEVESAAVRLLETMWTSEDDPMRALHKRSESFGRLGNGAGDVRTKFDLTITALQAVHEDRPVRLLKTQHPDYARLVRASSSVGLRPVGSVPPNG